MTNSTNPFDDIIEPLELAKLCISLAKKDHEAFVPLSAPNKNVPGKILLERLGLKDSGNLAKIVRKQYTVYRNMLTWFDWQIYQQRKREVNLRLEAEANKKRKESNDE